MLNGKKSIQVKRKHWDKQNTLEGTIQDSSNFLSSKLLLSMLIIFE
jgi:hypothetical protein